MTPTGGPARPGAWEGPLLPPGWRPDRDTPAEAGDDERRWYVVDPAGRLRLGDGTAVLLRPFRPGDGGLLVDGFARLSPRSRYRRFLSPVPHLTDSMLTFLTSVDGMDHRAFGALVDERPVAAETGGRGTVPAGVVRWVRTKADPAVADMAVTVIDAFQGRGLGGLMLDVAVLDAAAHGVDRFEGVVLGENIASRRMLARAGATFRPEGAGVLAFRLPLRPRVDVLRRSPLPALVASAGLRTTNA